MDKYKNDDDMYSWGVCECEQRIWKKALALLEGREVAVDNKESEKEDNNDDDLPFL